MLLAFTAEMGTEYVDGKNQDQCQVCAFGKYEKGFTFEIKAQENYSYQNPMKTGQVDPSVRQQ